MASDESVIVTGGARVGGPTVRMILKELQSRASAQLCVVRGNPVLERERVGHQGLDVLQGRRRRDYVLAGRHAGLRLARGMERLDDGHEVAAEVAAVEVPLPEHRVARVVHVPPQAVQLVARPRTFNHQTERITFWPLRRMRDPAHRAHHRAAVVRSPRGDQRKTKERSMHARIKTKHTQHMNTKASMTPACLEGSRYTQPSLISTTFGLPLCTVGSDMLPFS